MIETKIDGMRRREQVKQRRRDGALMSQVEEIQWVGEWTLEYGLVVFESVHGSVWVKRKLQDRLEQLRSLRFWDFVVTHDALRGSKKLYKEQSHSAYWTAYRMSTIVTPLLLPLLTWYRQHHAGAYQKGRLAPSKPPPPATTVV